VDAIRLNAQVNVVVYHRAIKVNVVVNICYLLRLLFTTVLKIHDESQGFRQEELLDGLFLDDSLSV
jgi:hypothetical protein